MIEGQIIYDADKFRLAKNKEGLNKYYKRFYLQETKDLLQEECPELFK